MRPLLQNNNTDDNNKDKGKDKDKDTDNNIDNNTYNNNYNNFSHISTCAQGYAACSILHQKWNRLLLCVSKLFQTLAQTKANLPISETIHAVDEAESISQARMEETWKRWRSSGVDGLGSALSFQMF